MPDSLSSFVVDANIFIDLRTGDVLEDFFRLPHAIVTPDIICTELLVPPCDHLLALGLRTVSLPGDQMQEAAQLQQEKYRGLSIADLSVLFLARGMNTILLTGDGLLRKIAASNGVVVHGTLWILEHMIAHSVLTYKKAAQALRQMIAQDCHLPIETAHQYLAVWEMHIEE